MEKSHLLNEKSNNLRITLRGHHLLCLQGFEGYGYNDEFVENMKKINTLRKDENATIKVVSKDDDICKACPNLKNNLCKDICEDKKIKSMDLKVLEKLPNEKTFNSKELFEIVNKKFNSLNTVTDICLGCKWWDICTFIKKLEKR